MDKKLMLALAALLGFSTACSSVKNAPKGDKVEPEANVAAVPDSSHLRRIIVMYGVRRPINDSIRNERLKQLEGQETPAPGSSRVTVDPVAEKPIDE